jgi:hypothetical protein
MFFLFILVSLEREAKIPAPPPPPPAPLISAPLAAQFMVQSNLKPEKYGSLPKILPVAKSSKKIMFDDEIELSMCSSQIKKLDSVEKTNKSFLASKISFHYLNDDQNNKKSKKEIENFPFQNLSNQNKEKEYNINNNNELADYFLNNIRKTLIQNRRKLTENNFLVFKQLLEIHSNIFDLNKNDLKKFLHIDCEPILNYMEKCGINSLCNFLI